MKQILDLMADELNLTAEERKGEDHVKNKLKMYENTIKVDMKREEIEAEMAFKKSILSKESKEKEGVMVPSYLCVREGRKEGEGCVGEVLESSRSSVEREGFVSSLSSWFKDPKFKTE